PPRKPPLSLRSGVAWRGKAVARRNAWRKPNSRASRLSRHVRGRTPQPPVTPLPGIAGLASSSVTTGTTSRTSSDLNWPSGGAATIRSLANQAARGCGFSTCGIIARTANRADTRRSSRSYDVRDSPRRGPGHEVQRVHPPLVVVESWPTHRIHPYLWPSADELILAKGCVRLVVRGAGITSLRRRVEVRPLVRVRPKGRASIARFIRSCVHCTNA